MSIGWPKGHVLHGLPKPLPSAQVQLSEKVGVCGENLFRFSYGPEKLQSSRLGIGYVVCIPTHTSAEPWRICKLFEERGFGRGQTEFSRIALVFAINEMWSVIGNPKVQEMVYKDDKAPFRVEKFGFTWQPVWTCGKKRLKTEQIQWIYDVCCKKCLKVAKRLRAAKASRKVIPYAGILEQLRLSDQVASCITCLRQEQKDRPIYLLLQHADVLMLKAVFNAYDTLLKAHKAAMQQFPIVATTGYHIESQEPLNALGVEIDMAVRRAIQKIIPPGAYPPEPNVALYVNPGQSTVDVSFIHKRFSREMLAFMANMKERGAKHFAWDIRSPVVLKERERMAKRSGKLSSPRRHYGARCNTEKKIVRWTPQDLVYWTHLSQSHATPRQWGERVMWVYFLEIKPTGPERKQIATCAASLFEIFHPLKLAKDRPLEQILSSYTLSIDKKEVEAKAKEIASSLQKRVSEQRAHGIAKEVLRAAYASGKAIVQLLSERLELDFTKRSLAILEDVFGEAIEFSEGSIQRDILEGRIRDGKNELSLGSIKTKVAQSPKDSHGITALHVAALVGDDELMRFLLKHKLCKKTSVAKGKIYPVHLAIERAIDVAGDLTSVRRLMCDGAVEISVKGAPPFERILRKCDDIAEEDFYGLISLGCSLVDVNPETGDGALHAAYGNNELIGWILDREEIDDVTLKNRAGDSVVDYVLRDEDVECFQLLLPHISNLKEVLEEYSPETWDWVRSLTYEELYHPSEEGYIDSFEEDIDAINQMSSDEVTEALSAYCPANEIDALSEWGRRQRLFLEEAKYDGKIYESDHEELAEAAFDRYGEYSSSSESEAETESRASQGSTDSWLDEGEAHPLPPEKRRRILEDDGEEVEGIDYPGSQDRFLWGPSSSEEEASSQDGSSQEESEGEAFD